MQVLGHDPDDRLFVSLPAAVLAVTAAAVASVGVTWVARDGGGAAQGSTTAAGGSATACEVAVQRADEALAVAAGVDEALDAHTAVVEDLMAGRLSAQEAVQRTLPDLTRGAQASLDLDVAVQRYEAVARDCRS